MSADIARFGGKVEKFAGDAVLALFGVPVAREADAERAVHCAWNLHASLVPLARDVAKRWNVDLALRVGVNTGEAVSGMVKAGGLDDYTVVTGDVVNTAARLQTAAEPGTTMVGAVTMRLTQRSVRFGERQELRLKGKAAPVPAFPIIGLRDHLAERWEAGERQTPLVGREHEIETVVQAWERSKRGEAQLVTILGEAGIGKSRLLAEAAQRVIADGTVHELRARCLNYGQNVSLSLIADLLRALLGVSEQDEAPRIAVQVASVVQSLLNDADNETKGATVDVVGEVLGLSPGDSVMANAGAQARRLTLVKSLRLMLVGLSRENPVLMILEDLHWIDPGSAEVLEALLVDISELRLLVLAAQRPDWSSPWRDWSWVERISLRPFPSEEAAALARAVTGDIELSPELENYVTDRAGGNPFYIEELLQALQDADGLVSTQGRAHLVASEADKLPASLTEIVLARLDRLDEHIRSLVQVASVIGRSFAVDLLAETVGSPLEVVRAPLESLARAEIAFPRAGLRPEYVFKHVTLRDVAYNTLLQKRRQELHGAVAEAVETLYASDEYVEVVAYHYAMTENHEKAAIWLERAGDRAADMFANQLAVKHYEEARKRLLLLDADSASMAHLAEKLGRTFAVVAWYDEAIDELEDAILRYRSLNDLEGEARTGAELGRVHFLRGANEDGIKAVQNVLERYQESAHDSHSAAMADLHMALVEPLHHGRRFKEALDGANVATEISKFLEVEAVQARALARRALALHGVGRLAEADVAAAEAVDLSQRTGDLENLSKSLIWQGDTYLAQARVPSAVACFERALKVSEDRGDLTETAYALHRLGHALCVVGDWARARSVMEHGVDLVRSISFAHFSAFALMALGQQYLLEGETERASRYLEEPLIIADRSGQHAQIPYLQALLARQDLFDDHPDVALKRVGALLAQRSFDTPADHDAMQIAAEALGRTGAITDATSLIEEGLTVSDSQGNMLAKMIWLHVRGSLASAQGMIEEAEPALDEALMYARAAPYPYVEAQVLRTSGLLRIGHHKVERGNHDLQESLAIFKRLGARPQADRSEGAITELGYPKYLAEPV